MIIFQKIESKWQKKWEESKIFKANPDKRKKFFLNAPYPYMNAVPHIGHFYTYMRAEALARYKRMRGYNVLFPQGWHCTGSPIVAAARRIKEGEKDQTQSLKNQGFSEQEIKKFEDPKYWTKIFPKIWKKAFKSIGISYDDRRSFITTELNPHYDKFVRWQFNKLKEKGLIEKGKHPVVWDPKTNLPVGDHDRIKGEGEVPQEFILFKHELSPNRFVLSATLRQDTCLGITNLYVHPNYDYTEVETKGEQWIINDSSAEKLKQQGFNIKIIGKISGKDLIGKKVKVVDGRSILILPATFLDPEVGTGLVHSVPSDSADDLIALEDLKKDRETMLKYKLNPEEINTIKPIPILDTPGLGSIPAEAIIKKYGIISQKDKQKLEKAKEELYKTSFYTATFNNYYKNFFSRDLSGMKVQEAKDFIKKELIKMGKIEIYYELTGEVISRSLTKCIVKIVSDQWFIKYSDKNWKKQTKEALKLVKLYPEGVREQFLNVIDWLNDWACTREYGLGTRLPFDKKWLIESLSDSTVYMAYYTIVHLIEKIPIKKIDDKFFDYIFLDKGKKPKIKNINKIKKEFEYWYPVDFRNSGKDLVQNHLAFYLFNHVAIFNKKHWPRGIGVNGWVRVDNQKMSKSLGNTIPLQEIAEKFGADVSRITILNGGEGIDDPNWDTSFAEMIKAKLEQLYNFSIKNYNKGITKTKIIDKWAESQLNEIIKDTTNYMEETLFRSAIQKAYFDLERVLKWYLRRTMGEPNKKIINKFIETKILLMIPFTPHICEEIWEKLKGKGSVPSTWPKFTEKKIDLKLNALEGFVNKVLSDIRSILKLTKKEKPKKIILYTTNKRMEFKVLYEAKNFLEKELNTKLLIFKVDDPKKIDPLNKSMKAKPGKPAIYVE